MSLNFFPRVIKFFDLFRQQQDIVNQAVGLLVALFDHPSDMAEKCKKINELEYAGNDISRKIARELALTFITPIDREDIHSINISQENFLNSIRALSTRVGLYQLKQINPGSNDLIAKLFSINECISGMLDLLGKRKEVEEQAEKARVLKQEADTLLLLLLGEVYERKAVTPEDLLEIIKWSHIYDRIGDSFSFAEMVVNVIEGITLKNA